MAITQAHIQQKIYQKILGLEQEQNQLIASEEFNGETIQVREFEHYRWMNIDGSSIQSLMNVKNPSQVLLPNTQAMLGSLLFCPRPTSVLNLGMGGGVFERWFLEKFPELKFTTVELSEGVISVAKRYFVIPEKVNVYSGSAEDYLKVEAASHDIILCDIFSKESHPSCLLNDKFYANIFNVLEIDGVLAINLSPVSETELIEILLPLRAHFPWVSLLTVPGCANIILYATQQKPPENAELGERSGQLINKFSLDLTELVTGIRLLPPKIVTNNTDIVS